MREFDELKLARVIDACGGINGRVKMQKIVYLLKVMGYDLPFDDFTIRQHGPFSRSVACATDVLNNAGIVEEQEEPLSESSFGNPMVQYSYTFRADLADLVRQKFDVVAPSGKPIEDATALLIERDRAVLEVAATQFFLEQEGLSGKDLDAELSRLKGHLSSRFSEATNLVGTIRQESLL